MPVLLVEVLKSWDWGIVGRGGFARWRPCHSSPAVGAISNYDPQRCFPRTPEVLVQGPRRRVEGHGLSSPLSR